ncbi:hypothetical protein SK128_014491, partial [Halocaridina rubra]
HFSVFIQRSSREHLSVVRMRGSMQIAFVFWFLAGSLLGESPVLEEESKSQPRHLISLRESWTALTTPNNGGENIDPAVESTHVQEPAAVGIFQSVGNRVSSWLGWSWYSGEGNVQARVIDNKSPRFNTYTKSQVKIRPQNRQLVSTYAGEDTGNEKTAADDAEPPRLSSVVDLKEKIIEKRVDEALEPDELDLLILTLGRSLGIDETVIGENNYLSVVSIKGILSVMEATQCTERLLCHLEVDESFFRSPVGRVFLFVESVMPFAVTDKVNEAVKKVMRYRTISGTADANCGVFRCLSEDNPILSELYQITSTFMSHLLESGCLERLACEWGIVGLLPETLGEMAAGIVSEHIANFQNNTSIPHFARTVQIMSHQVQPHCEDIPCGFLPRQKK